MNKFSGIFFVSSHCNKGLVNVDGRNPVPHGVAYVFIDAYTPDPVPWLPVYPNSYLNFKSLIKFTSKNFSLLILHPSVNAGKTPY